MKNLKVYRIIDANLNRAREGLRVIEDGARFLFNDKTITSKITKLRHSLESVTRKIYPELIAARDSVRDVRGSQKEEKRKDLKGVFASNFRRVEEAMRVLEEYSKLVSKDAGHKFKKIRFSLYIIEKQLMRKLS
ncbi:MAG: thiamine-phosphate pyrophosphorylase [bacterium]